jgi:hypothetical protein
MHWIKRFAGKAPNYPGTAYVLLHSLSHALMAEIALDCGYPASLLKERIYVLSDTPSAIPDRCGILIYTATAGAQGTLGGLVGTASRFAGIPSSMANGYWRLRRLKRFGIKLSKIAYSRRRLNC